MVADAFVPVDSADTPIEGSQWSMPWEWTAEQRAKAGIPDGPRRALRPEWKDKLDAVDPHNTSSTST